MFSFLRRLLGITGAAGGTAASAADPDHPYQRHGPTVNVDGTPMAGAVDIHGNPFGVVSPAVNVDGTPMVGWVDIHGNPYGVTNDDHGSGDHWGSHDRYDCGGGWSSGNDWSSGSCGGSRDW
jgi:hypothetical protein